MKGQHIKHKYSYTNVQQYEGNHKYHNQRRREMRVTVSEHCCETLVSSHAHQLPVCFIYLFICFDKNYRKHLYPVIYLLCAESCTYTDIHIHNITNDVLIKCRVMETYPPCHVRRKEGEKMDCTQHLLMLVAEEDGRKEGRERWKTARRPPFIHTLLVQGPARQAPLKH